MKKLNLEVAQKNLEKANSELGALQQELNKVTGDKQKMELAKASAENLLYLDETDKGMIARIKKAEKELEKLNKEIQSLGEKVSKAHEKVELAQKDFYQCQGESFKEEVIQDLTRTSVVKQLAELTQKLQKENENVNYHSPVQWGKQFGLPTKREDNMEKLTSDEHNAFVRSQMSSASAEALERSREVVEKASQAMLKVLAEEGIELK